MNKIKAAGIVLFCMILAGFSLLSFAAPQKEYSDLENRSLERKPELSLEEIRTSRYQERYEKYLTDQMPLRDQWVKLAADLERLAGRKEINGVYIGRDGYLLEKYKAADFDGERVDGNIDILSRFINEAVKTYGKQHVSCMLLPSKANALPARLPAYADVNDEEDVTAELKKKLEHPDIFLDACKILRSHQDEYIYYRTDHHWTTLGAYYTYCAWAELTGHPVRRIEDYRRETVFKDFYGTTYNKAHVNVKKDYVELFHGPGEEGVRIRLDDEEKVYNSFYFPEEAVAGFNRYLVFLSKNTGKINIRTKAGTGKSLLLVKDSFANCFVPFLCEYYDKIVMIDCRYSKENIREFLKKHDGITDILVMYNIEKFMQDTNMQLLDKKSDSVEEFNLDDFMAAGPGLNESCCLQPMS